MSDDTLNISWDDLDAPSTAQSVQRLRAAQSAPLVREVGTAPEQNSSWLRGPVAQYTFAGIAGGLLTWGMVEPLQNADVDASTSNVISSAMFAVGIGLALLLSEGVSSRSGAVVGRDLVTKGPIVVVAGLIMGFIMDPIYQGWVEAIVEDVIASNPSSAEEAMKQFTTQIHFARGTAWAMIGVAVGGALGLAARKSQKAINGIIGGAIGGFLAGAVFDFFQSGLSARLFGTVLTGLAIGLGVGLVETARRQHWLEILSGGMAGKQFILYSGTTSVGAAPNCDVTLIKDPGIAAHHLTLSSSGTTLRAAAAPGALLTVNGVGMQNKTLADGDVLTLGSTQLRYRGKGETAIPTGQIIG